MMTNNELLEKISQIITGQKKERITITSAYANLKKYVEINCRPDTVLFYDKYYNSSIVYFSKFKIRIVSFFAYFCLILPKVLIEITPS